MVEKIVGAAAERGDDLASLKALGERVNAASGSMGVALTSCTVPAAGTPTFELGEGEIEMGVGIHGEPGRRRVALQPADAIAAELVGAICEEMKPDRGDGLLLFVNGMGGTPLMELYLMYDAALRQMQARGLTVAREPRRQLLHLARDGGRVGDADPARRRDDRALGRAGPHRGAAPGNVSGGCAIPRP